MNRYSPIKTNDQKILILDTIIRMPDTFKDCMTREARSIRDSIPDLSAALLRSQNRAAVVCSVLGTGWEPMPDLAFVSRAETGRLYKHAVSQLAEYLTETGELYDELVVV